MAGAQIIQLKTMRLARHFIGLVMGGKNDAKTKVLPRNSMKTNGEKFGLG
jgi:hypothetical protein